MKHFILFSCLILIFIYLTGNFFQWPTTYHQSKFLNEATSFYPTERAHKHDLTVTNSAPPSLLQHENSELRFRELEKEINLHYENFSSNIINHLPLIISKQNEIKILLATNDRKIDQSILLDPLFRLAICAYLDISCDYLNESSWSNGEITSEVWSNLYFVSQSNDFKLLILENALSKEKLEGLLKKYSHTK